MNSVQTENLIRRQDCLLPVYLFPVSLPQQRKRKLEDLNAENVVQINKGVNAEKVLVVAEEEVAVAEEEVAVAELASGSIVVKLFRNVDGGIRTHARRLVPKTSALDHSATSTNYLFRFLTRIGLLPSPQ